MTSLAGLVAALLWADEPASFAKDVALVSRLTTVEILTDATGARLALAPAWGGRVVATALSVDSPSHAYVTSKSWGEDELAVRGDWKVVKRGPTSLSLSGRDLLGTNWTRSVRFLDAATAWKRLKIAPLSQVRVLSYESLNTVGAASIPVRVVSRYPAGESTSLILPIHAGFKRDYGVPAGMPRDQYALAPTHLFVRGDGRGFAPLKVGRSSGTGTFGSFDPLRGVLTVVQVSKGVTYSASSTDGMVSLESLLQPAGKSRTLVQQTYHFSGDLSALAQVARKTLGCDVTELVKPTFWAPQTN